MKITFTQKKVQLKLKKNYDRYKLLYGDMCLQLSCSDILGFTEHIKFKRPKIYFKINKHFLKIFQIITTGQQ